MANLIDVLAAGIVDDSGTQLTNGVVYFYEAGTTTPLTVYQDADASLPHSNPATLDAAGKLVAYASTKLKLVIEASDGTAVDTIDDIPTGQSSADIVTTTGTDSDNFSETSLSEILEDAAESFGNDWKYKYKTVGEDRTYLSRGADRVSVKDFGAVGDGVTDDTAAINSAISSLTAGATVYFPAGTYSCSANIEVNVSNITLLGEGRASKLEFPADGSKVYITVDYVTVDGLWLDGTSAASSVSEAYGIHAEGTNSDRILQIHIRNCIVTNWARAGVFLQYTERSSVVNCYIEDAYYIGIGLSSSKYFQVHNNFIKDIDADGVIGTNAYGITMINDYGVDDPCRYGSITGNVVEDCPTWAGIDSHSGSDYVIANNMVENCLYGISMQSRDDEPDIPQNITVVGNVCTGTNPSDGTDGGAGIEYFGGSTVQVKNVNIVGNVVKDFGKTDVAGRAGIRGQFIDGFNITGNVIHDCRPNGIWIGSQVYGLSIVGNTIVDAYTNDATVGRACGVRVDGTAGSGGVIMGNTFEVDDASNTYVMTVGIRLPNATDQDNTKIAQNKNEAATYIEHAGFAEDFGYHGAHEYDPYYHLPLSSSGPTRTNKQWYQGDWVRNSDPDRADPIGWICLADSSPGSSAGTWLRMPPMIDWQNQSSIPTNTGGLGDVALNSDFTSSTPAGWVWQDNSSEWWNWPGGAPTPGDLTTQKRVFWLNGIPSSTAPASTKAWNRGDICWNSEPSAGGDPGWICTTAGTPGTWKAFANIDA